MKAWRFCARLIADSALKESNLERVKIAIETNAVSRQDLDRAQAERDAAVAGVLGARARDSPGPNSTTTTRWYAPRSPGKWVGAE